MGKKPNTSHVRKTKCLHNFIRTSSSRTPQQYFPLPQNLFSECYICIWNVWELWWVPPKVCSSHHVCHMHLFYSGVSQFCISLTEILCILIELKTSLFFHGSNPDITEHPLGLQQPSLMDLPLKQTLQHLPAPFLLRVQALLTRWLLISLCWFTHSLLFPTCHGQRSWAAEAAAANFALNAQKLYKWHQPNFYLSSSGSHGNWGTGKLKKHHFSFISLSTFCSETSYRGSAGSLLCSPMFSTFERFNTS